MFLAGIHVFMWLDTSDISMDSTLWSISSVTMKPSSGPLPETCWGDTFPKLSYYRLSCLYLFVLIGVHLRQSFFER